MSEVLLGLAIVVLALLIASIRVANEYERGVIFRLGRYVGIRGPGLYLLIPVIEWQRKVDLRTQTVNVERQESITRDSVTINVNAVLWFKVSDPARAIISVGDFRAAVYQVALTSLRNIIGQHVLDEVLKERDKINSGLQEIVDKATEPWGIQVEMVEMKDVEIPTQMQRAMAQEAQAIREKRARIIKAEAEEEASAKLGQAAGIIASNPVALELRRMQMITEVGAEQNTTTIIMMPTDFVTVARKISESLELKGKGAGAGAGGDGA